jgi:hypothetical protein
MLLPLHDVLDFAPIHLDLLVDDLPDYLAQATAT